MTSGISPLLVAIRGQRGFTLIEMLVVIAILGILAGVVSMSMIGITNLAQSRADQGELMTVQSALDFMIMDQQIDPGDACAGAPAAGTKDMSRFPSTQSFVQPGGRSAVRLYPHYLRKQMMNRAYVCVGGGEVQPAHS